MLAVSSFTGAQLAIRSGVARVSAVPRPTLPAQAFCHQPFPSMLNHSYDIIATKYYGVVAARARSVLFEASGLAWARFPPLRGYSSKTASLNLITCHQWPEYPPFAVYRVIDPVDMSRSKRAIRLVDVIIDSVFCIYLIVFSGRARFRANLARTGAS